MEFTTLKLYAKSQIKILFFNDLHRIYRQLNGTDL